VVVGVGLAVVLAVCGSITMPIGSARLAEPSPGLDVDVLVLGAGALLLVGLLGAAAVVGAMRTVRLGLDGSAAKRGRRPVASLLASGRFSPSSQLGVSMALDPGEGRTAVPVRSALVGVAFGVAGVVAALTFGNGLDSLVDKPAASGWNWTLRVDAEDDDVATLLDVDGVQDVGRIHFGGVVAEGERLTGVSMRAETGTPSFTVVDGRMPSGSREVALGPKTAEKLGVGIGDTVAVEAPDSESGTLDAVVVGKVLLPTFDDNAFNEGIALAPDVHASVAQSSGFDEIVTTFADGIDQDEAAARVEKVLPDSLSVYGFPSPPPDVENLAGVQRLPRLLGLFLGLLALAAVGHALATSVRRRRHDLGIVRSLGFVGRDVVRTLTAQSWTLAALGLVVGIPLGIAIGRVAWGVVAEGIGVRPDASTSLGVVAAVVVLSGLAAALLALLPGILAARQRAVDTLRVE
jgi:ABC-type lipoprotein release transport system permease subunit